MIDHTHDHDGPDHHDHEHGDSAEGFEPADWDQRYAASEQIWSGNPNVALVAEVEGLKPGTALDIGCGEGADVVWLAKNGWQVTAVDVSSVALGRAAQHVADAGVAVEFHLGGLLEVNLWDAPYDLVAAHYPVLKKDDGRSIAALLGLVALGGTLLYVHHADIDTEEMRAKGFDTTDYVLPPDLKTALDSNDAWQVEVFERRDRHVESGAGAGHSADIVLRARRS